jgi:hypothetical protein
MMDADDGDTEGVRHGLGESDADEKCPDETWTIRHGNRVQGIARNSCVGEGTLDDGDYRREVRPRCDFRHHAAEYTVHVLRENHEGVEHGVIATAV